MKFLLTVRYVVRFLLGPLHRTVFFNHFVATESSANVAHVTLCNGPNVYVYCYKHIELWLRISSQAKSIYFSGTLAATRLKTLP